MKKNKERKILESKVKTSVNSTPVWHKNTNVERMG